MRGPADALEYGVKVTGATLFVVDSGVDTGPIVAQTAVTVDDDDDVETLHERIKAAERAMLTGAVGRMCREGFTVTGRKVRFGGPAG
jgi:phosphoribosylglycinamide formyltransferase-1